MNLAVRDIARMERAASLAQKGGGHADPCPIVGAVIVRGGSPLGGGYRERDGGPHAEINALADASRAIFLP